MFVRVAVPEGWSCANYLNSNYLDCSCWSRYIKSYCNKKLQQCKWVHVEV